MGGQSLPPLQCFLNKHPHFLPNTFKSNIDHPWGETVGGYWHQEKTWKRELYKSNRGNVITWGDAYFEILILWKLKSADRAQTPNHIINNTRKMILLNHCDQLNLAGLPLCIVTTWAVLTHQNLSDPRPSSDCAFMERLRMIKYFLIWLQKKDIMRWLTSQGFKVFM